MYNMDSSTSNSSDPAPVVRKIATATRKKLSPDQRVAIMKSFEPRKIAQPVNKHIAPELRSSIVDDLEPRKFVGRFRQTRQSDWIKLMANENLAQAEQMQENAAMTSAFNGTARAMAEALREDLAPLRSREENIRAKHIKVLTVTLSAIVNMIQQKNRDDKRAYYANMMALRDPKTEVAAFVDDKLVYLDAQLLAHVWEAKVWRRTYEVDLDLDNYVDQMEMEMTDLELWEAHFGSELDGYEMFREHFGRYFGNEKNVWLYEVQDAE